MGPEVEGLPQTATQFSVPFAGGLFFVLGKVASDSKRDAYEQRKGVFSVMKDAVRDAGPVDNTSSAADAGLIRILVTDDSGSIRALIRQKLLNLADADMPLLIDEAESGEHAIDLASAVAYDVIFLDVEMPGIGGLETCRQIKSRSAARLVMLSSMDSGRDHLAGREAGCDNYLTKPPNDSDLRVILRLVSIRKMTMG